MLLTHLVALQNEGRANPDNRRERLQRAGEQQVRTIEVNQAHRDTGEEIKVPRGENRNRKSNRREYENKRGNSKTTDSDSKV